MKRKTYLNIFVIALCISIIGALILYIESVKNQIIPNLSGTYQSEQFVEVKNDSKSKGQEKLQLSFMEETGMFYEAYNNNYAEEGTYIKDANYDNIYKIKLEEKENIVIAEKEYIYYIEGTNVSKLKFILPEAVIPEKTE